MLHVWRSWPPYARRVSVRLACLPVLLFVVYSGIFLLAEVVDARREPITIPGDIPEAAICARFPMSPRCASMLDRYGNFWGNVVTLDFGVDYRTERPIRAELAKRIPRTLNHAIPTLIAASLFSVLLAVGLRSGSNGSSLAYLFGTSGLASLAPFLALYAWIVLPSWYWNWGVVEPGGLPLMWNEPFAFIRTVIPIALMVGAIVGASVATVVSRVLKPPRCASSLLQAFVMAAALSLPAALSAAVIVELLVSEQGAALYAFQATVTREIPVAEASLVLLALVAFAGWALCPDGAKVPNPPQARLEPNKALLIIGGIVLTGFLLASLAGFAIGDSATQISPENRLLSPSWSHPFGTSRFGQDQFKLTLVACWASLKFSAIAVGLGLLPGLLVAWVVSRVSTKASAILEIASSAWLALPALLVAFAFVFAFDPGFRTTALVTALFAFAHGLRRGEVLKIAADRVDMRQVMLVALSAAAQVAAFAVLFDATLGFLGIGPEIGSPNFGYLISRGFKDGYDYRYLCVFPSLALTTSLFGFHLLRRAFDDIDPPQSYER